MEHRKCKPLKEQTIWMTKSHMVCSKGHWFHRKRVGTNVDRSNHPLFHFVLIFSCLFFLGTGCASLLPPERRVYPKNPVMLPEGLDIHQWMELKKKQYETRLSFRQISDLEYKVTYFQKEHTPMGSYIACTALVKSLGLRQIEIYNMISTVNYADYTKGYMRKGGDLGPMDEKERTETLIPCIEEFLTHPKTKDKIL